MDLLAASKSNEDSKEPALPDTYDVAVSSLCYHHLPDIGLATSAVVARLRSGGRLFVVELRATEKSLGKGGEVSTKTATKTEAETEKPKRRPMIHLPSPPWRFHTVRPGTNL